jgi:uncharacterized protein YqgC (DUF456 family)
MLVALGYAAALLIALLLIPLGLPGLWLQVAASALLATAWAGALLPWGWVMGFAVLAGIAELLELLLGRWGARRFGGSNRAAWGALIGGVAGALVGGIPVPLLGAVIMSFTGTFVGAIVGEISARRSVTGLRVGVGAVIGRAVGVAAKMAAGVLIAGVGLGAVVIERLR